MKFACSAAHGIAGIVALVAILGIGMNACVDHLSRQLDNVDPTNEEMVESWGGKR